MASKNPILRRTRHEDEFEDAGKGPYIPVRSAKVDGGSNVKQFIIVSQQNDSLTCKTWDGETAGTDDYIILKPWLLRRTPFDNLTRNGISYVYTSAFERTASKVGEDDEEQVISPKYVVDDIIEAESGIEGLGGWLQRSQGRAWSWVEA